MITHNQLTERLLYIFLIIMFILNIAIYVKLTVDDGRKFRQLKRNQDQLICIVKESTNPNYTTIDPKTFKFTIDNSYIDRCVEANK